MQDTFVISILPSLINMDYDHLLRTVDYMRGDSVSYRGLDEFLSLSPSQV